MFLTSVDLQVVLVDSNVSSAPPEMDCGSFSPLQFPVLLPGQSSGMSFHNEHLVGFGNDPGASTLESWPPFFLTWNNGLLEVEKCHTIPGGTKIFGMRDKLV
jgi:hypothetical protein